MNSSGDEGTMPESVYALRPRDEWNLKEERGWPVVVVISKYCDDTRFGNGVLVAQEKLNALVLTCSHLVRLGGRTVSEIRVGILDISFENRRDVPGYLELLARVRAEDSSRDLALLEIECPGQVYTTKLGSTDPNADDRGVTLSVFPFGKPESMPGWDAYVYRGQSGSPVIRQGVLVGILRGVIEEGMIGSAGPGTWIGTDDINKFLSDLSVKR